MVVTASNGSPPLVLLSQTPWVGQGQPFDLKLRPVAPGVPPGQLGLSVAVYPCLTSVSGFDQSLSAGSPGTPVSSTPSPLPVSGLPTVTGGGVDLSMPVVVGEATASPTGRFTIGLTAQGDECGAYPSGVYPVRVLLVDLADHQTVAGITTFLVYAAAGDATQKLRVAVVLPVQTPLVPAAAPTPGQLLIRPTAAIAPPSAASVGALSGMVDALSASPGVAVTLEASPATMTALAASGHQSTVDELASLSADPSVHQFPATTYAPVDASGLVDAGLGTELHAQVVRGAQVLTTSLGRSTGGDASAGLGVWVSADPLDTATLAQLLDNGYTRVVLPSTSVTGAPTNGSAAETFALPSSHGAPVTALAADDDLTARFTGAPGNPVLAAHQLLGELAQIYYEKPNDTTARVVAAVAPDAWGASPSLVSALLGGLEGSPILEAVTVDGAFATVPTPAACRNTCRLLPSGGDPGLPVAAIRAQRQRVDGFTSAALGAPGRTVSSQLGDLVLSSESTALRPDQQSGLLDNTGVAVDAQLSQLAVAGDRTVTLTSQRGTLQVTLVSSAPYPVDTVLSLTSDKLLFADGTTEWSQNATLLPDHTNVVPVTVRARTSGEFRVDIVLHSPNGGLELSSGTVDVRSTATSVVGVVLSLGAVAVLVVWWLRTSRRRRALRLRDDADEPHGTAFR